MISAQQIIELFDMKPLPDEGGFYVETYRAKEKIDADSLPPAFDGDRNISTAILYLLTPQTCSRMHRVRSDEIFHFYLGDPVTMLHLKVDGSSAVLTLGHDILDSQQVQITVPANIWQGCLLNEGGKFALLGCTIAPGFEFADYQSANRKELVEKYPDQKELILKLT